MRKLSDILAEQARADADDRDLRSRTDARYERLSLEESLAKLGKDLIALTARKLAALDLPEAVLDAVSDAQAIASAAAQNRQLKVVRSRLRDADWAGIRARLDTLLKHGTIVRPAAKPAEPPLPDWAARLLAGGSEALEAFLTDHPDADRSQLRQLIRNVHKAKDAVRAKAAEKLSRLIRTLDAKS